MSNGAFAARSFGHGSICMVLTLSLLTLVTSSKNDTGSSLNNSQDLTPYIIEMSKLRGQTKRDTFFFRTSTPPSPSATIEPAVADLNYHFNRDYHDLKEAERRLSSQGSKSSIRSIDIMSSFFSHLPSESDGEGGGEVSGGLHNFDLSNLMTNQFNAIAAQTAHLDMSQERKDLIFQMMLGSHDRSRWQELELNKADLSYIDIVGKITNPQATYVVNPMNIHANNRANNVPAAHSTHQTPASWIATAQFKKIVHEIYIYSTTLVCLIG
jgi:hypothetical protein